MMQENIGDAAAPEREPTADEWVRSQLYDRAFQDWLWEHGFDWTAMQIAAAPDGEPASGFKSITSAVALLWDVWLGERRKASEMEAEAKQLAEQKAEVERRKAEQRAESERLTALANADAERRDAAAKESQDVARAGARAAFEALLADSALVRGEDDASLRAVAAWRRAGADLVRFAISEGPARDALARAEQVLDRDVRARLAEIARAQATNRDLARKARGLDDVPVPLPFELATDPDAVGRWLVAHAGSYELQVGRWETVTRTRREPAGGVGDWKTVPYVSRELRLPAGWDAVTDRAMRWAARAVAEREAKAQPEAAEDLRRAGLDVLTGQGAEWLMDELTEDWSFTPANDEPPEPARASRSAVKRVEEVTLESAARTVALRFAASAVRPTMKQICKAMRAAGARGQDKALRDAYQRAADDPALGS